MTELPSSDEALTAALRTIAAAGPSSAAHAGALTGGVPGTPTVVHTLSGEPSYVLVPVRLPDGGTGFVRVAPDGRVAAHGRYGGRGPLDLGADEVDAAVAAALEPGERADRPLLVHDGPPGREAWLVVTRIADAPSRWLLVTPGGIEVRDVGAHRDLDVE